MIIEAGGFTAQHYRPVAHHRNVAGKRADLRELMGDKDNADPQILQGADLTEQALGFAGGERGRGLVEDQERRLAHQPAQDLHHLLIRHFKSTGCGVEIELALELAELVGKAVIQVFTARQAKKNVLPHREVGKQHRLLGHQIDAQLVRLPGLKARKGAAGDGKFTRVGGFDPGDDLHQGGFSRAVPAHQGVYLTGKQREINPLQYRNARELLMDAARLYKWCHFRSAIEQMIFEFNNVQKRRR